MILFFYVRFPLTQRDWRKDIHHHIRSAGFPHFSDSKFKDFQGEGQNSRSLKECGGGNSAHVLHCLLTVSSHLFSLFISLPERDFTYKAISKKHTWSCCCTTLWTKLNVCHSLIPQLLPTSNTEHTFLFVGLPFTFLFACYFLFILSEI